MRTFPRAMCLALAAALLSTALPLGFAQEASQPPPATPPPTESTASGNASSPSSASQVPPPSPPREHLVVLTVKVRTHGVSSFGMLLTQGDEPVGACLYQNGEVVKCADGQAPDIDCGEGRGFVTKGGVVQLDRIHVGVKPGTYDVRAAPFFINKESECTFEGIPLGFSRDYGSFGKDGVRLQGMARALALHFPAMRGIVNVHFSPSELAGYRLVLTREPSANEKGCQEDGKEKCEGGGPSSVTCEAWPKRPFACDDGRAEGIAGGVKLPNGRYLVRGYVLQEDAEGSHADPAWKVAQKHVNVRGGWTTNLRLLFRPA